MQIYNLNDVTFTSVLPIRVVDSKGVVVEQKIQKKACERITKILSGPVKKESDYDFLKKLALKDPEYSLTRAMRGYCSDKETPSSHFKIIFDSQGRPYILTGKDSEQLSILGRNIGLAQRECNIRGVGFSDALLYAKEQYNRAVKAILGDNTKIIKDEFTSISKQKIGDKNVITASVAVSPRKKDATKFDVLLRHLSIDKATDL